MAKTCKKCSKTSDEAIILLPSQGNITTPLTYCPKCIWGALNMLTPNIFPEGVVPSTSVLGDIVKADKKVFEGVMRILDGSTRLRFQNSMNASERTTSKKTVDNCSPQVIYDLLSERVIGQEDAKRKISLAIRRKAMSQANPTISKLNLMLIGPTASGKTELCKVASEMLSAPFIKVDCSHLTPAGYKGVNVDTILARLLDEAGGEMELAENGIVLLDEFDKLVQPGEFYGKIQQELLKIIEGASISFEIEKNRPSVTMDTSKILFIAAGAFQGIEEIVNPRKKSIKLASSGFEVIHESSSQMKVEANHLIKYGLIPELVGRFTHTATLKKLNEEELYQILCQKKGCVAKEYAEIFKEMGFRVAFTEEFLRGIAKKASESVTGARNLKFLMEEALGEYLFSERPLPSSIADNGLRAVA